MPDDPCALLVWDSEFWGFPVARAHGSTLDRELAERIDAWCEANEIGCLYLLADAGDAETGRVAAERGYRFVDVRVTMVHSPAKIAVPGDSPGVTIRSSLESDRKALRDLAARSHSDTRFFFDGNFPRSRCEQLYATWIEKEWSDPDTQLLVAAVDGEGDTAPGEVAGYATVGLRADPEIGGLIAVEPELGGRGIGTALVRATLRLAGADRAVRVVTQGRNTTAMRLYERCGFIVESTRVWYHRWYR